MKFNIKRLTPAMGEFVKTLRIFISLVLYYVIPQEDIERREVSLC